MDFQTIRQVSLGFGISRRMLCYYEEIGLLTSRRVDDYAYRVYDDAAIKQLQQIIILRKLQIPIRQIKTILVNQNAVETIEIFRQNIEELDERITAMSTLKSILARFVSELQEKADVCLKLDLLNDKTMITVIGSLPFPKNKIEERGTMSELNKINETLNKETAQRPKFSLCFVVARNDKEIIEVFEFYQRAFGATKIAEFVPYNTHIHIIMEIHGIEVLLNQDREYNSDTRRHEGGLWAFDDDDTLNKTISVLSENAIEVTMHSWEHWPIAAFITDKYGVKWGLHN